MPLRSTEQPQISVETTQMRVTDLLRIAIVSGELAPGEDLRQEELAAYYQVSRIPIRAALRQLEAEGFVKTNQHGKASVVELDTEEVLEIFEIRKALELLALQKAFPYMDDNSFEDAQRQIKAGKFEKDPYKWGESNKEFHLALFRRANSPRLLMMIANLHDQGGRYFKLKGVLDHYKKRSEIEHQGILDACRERNLDAAMKLLSGHLGDCRSAALDCLSI